MDRSRHPAPEKNECPTYSHTCKHCNRQHCFEAVCHSKGKPKPTSIPFPPTEENREKLKQWLFDHCNSSIFTMCEHQPLPMMDSPPMQLMVDPEAAPIAHHKRLPVPLHWRDEIKAALDQDVCLSLTELVLIGEPVTRCHCMVVCPKKKGKLCQIVVFQALNLHACNQRDPPYPVLISPGVIHPPWHQENSL